MLIALPTILNWMIASVATEAKLESALRRTKCSAECDKFGSKTNDITAGTFKSQAEPRRSNTASRQVEDNFARF